MSGTKRKIIEISLIIIIWIGIPIGQSGIIEGAFRIFPDKFVMRYILGDINLFVYIICLFLTVTLFLCCHGKRENLFYERKLNAPEWRRTGMLFFIYGVLAVISFIIYGVKLEVPYIVSMILANLLAVAMTEEIAFRRMLISCLEKWVTSKRKIIVFSTILFAMAHICVYLATLESWEALNFTILLINLLSLLGMGALLTAAYLQSKNIVPCVVVHAGQNVIAQQVYLDEGIGIMLYAAGFLASASLILFYRQKASPQKPSQRFLVK